MEASADPASDRLGSIPEVTLTSLGGEDAVLVDATAIAGSPALPRLVPAVELDWARLNRRHELIEVLRQGLLQPIGLLTFDHLADAWLAAPALRAATAHTLAKDFAKVAGGAGDPLVRAAAMEKLLRIAEDDPPVKYQLIASAMSVEPKTTPPQALARIVRVLGAAYELFGDRELLHVLDGFAQNELVTDTVEFERALIRIDMGLEAGTEEEAVENLAAAREGLERAYEIDPENLDAAIYRDVLDCVLMFRGGRPAADIAIIADRLKKEVASRALLQLGEQPRAWIGRRLTAQARWTVLADVLERLAGKLERPTWIDASKVLDQVFILYLRVPVIVISHSGRR
ncbi:MAG TPA: hypothetical protein VHS74_19320 [Solirubrobacterales bacterium]|nr:hypothetical protein [Solirubrobacterales bacterium]